MPSANTCLLFGQCGTRFSPRDKVGCTGWKLESNISGSLVRVEGSGVTLQNERQSVSLSHLTSLLPR